ncbi:hypothetical protein BDZ94DRAFT_1276184 [Collybia nuda]|uniref:Uncharacterized protein n=1 Tax=Collybia nuda TaxID=64659 RepID=A0A9P6CCQ1_9AGAR|nr:hypothetical protein BDZ94DRAFT_1276184 [Collybia nuda]
MARSSGNELEPKVVYLSGIFLRSTTTIIDFPDLIYRRRSTQLPPNCIFYDTFIVFIPKQFISN